jgi:SAM-dependent methyltransferase
MFYKRNLNTRSYNWLIHHYLIESVKYNTDFINGLVIDIGCGLKPYKNIIESKSAKYFGLESKSTLHGLTQSDVIGDALSLPFKDNISDTIISYQVMEHVPEPEKFMKEIYRILKPECYCILSTPFMWGEHEVPIDYYRYTRYGIKYLANKSGFEVININAETKFWGTIILRFNYYLMHRARKPLYYFFLPLVWLDQFIAHFLDKLRPDYSSDTAVFTTVLKK